MTMHARAVVSGNSWRRGPEVQPEVGGRTAGASRARGAAIRHLRQQRGWTQRQLAAAAQVPLIWLRLLESGQIGSPNSSRVEAVALALEIDPRQMLGDAAPLAGDATVDALPSETAWRVQRFLALPERLQRWLLQAADVLAATQDADGEPAPARRR